ncbi:MAG TPA: hypothetical protein VGJ86_25880 [Acidimicrobiales bacterium]|jgi:hypothetical protein
MPKAIWWVVIVVAVGLAAGCARESTNDAVERKAYVDAISAASFYNHPSHVSHQGRRCLARAYVGVIGVSGLREEVTPQRIRDHPDDTPSDWGIELDDEHGKSLYKEAKLCLDLRAPVLSFLAGNFPFTLVDAQVACLDENLEDGLLSTLALASLVQGPDMRLKEGPARAVYRLFNSCIGMQGYLVLTLTDDSTPEAIEGCLRLQINEDLSQRVWVEVFKSGRDGDPTGTEPIAELRQIADACSALS